MIGYPISEYEALSGGVSDILISGPELEARIAQMGRAISEDYAGKRPLLVGVLKGVIVFLSDLMRAIAIPIEVDFIDIASYSAESRDQGYVQFVKDLEISVTGRHVLFVEDVVDTGLTLHYLLGNMRARKPASLEVCALFVREQRRLIDVPIKYRGFDLPNKFVVGYGLDHRELYRNLPAVGLLKAEVLTGNG
ncbi:MAG: hypoxanthine phosphoribosyltransferase [Caldilineaceae bacterium]|jgi:hypoxanthine phosphoribosyltransferase